jgi:hypothetical protein
MKTTIRNFILSALLLTGAARANDISATFVDASEPGRPSYSYRVAVRTEFCRGELIRLKARYIADGVPAAITETVYIQRDGDTWPAWTTVSVPAVNKTAILLKLTAEEFAANGGRIEREYGNQY